MKQERTHGVGPTEGTALGDILSFVRSERDGERSAKRQRM